MTLKTLVACVCAAMVSIFSAAQAADTSPLSIGVHLKPLPLSARKGSIVDQIGDLTYLGGIRIISSERRLGGLSGLIVSRDGSEFVSVSDQADWVRGKIFYENGRLSGVESLTVGSMLDEQGKPLIHKKGDAEAVEQVDPSGPFPGHVVVAFEREHRLWRYDLGEAGFAARPLDLKIPSAVRALEDNQGIESLHITSDGEVIAITEGTYDDQGRTRGWVMRLNKDGLSVDGAQPLFLETWTTFKPTDLTRLADGRYLLLQRHFSPRTGPIIQLRDLGSELVQGGNTIAGALLAQLDMGFNIDNMEGLAARQTDDGRTLIYVISDDNFNPLQRTLLLMFEVKPAPVLEEVKEAEDGSGAAEAR